MPEKEDFIHMKFGYCYYTTEKSDAWKTGAVIYNLYVHPEYRRQGKSRKLLQYAINEIRESGYMGEIGIEATPRDDSISIDKLISFYKSMNLIVLNYHDNLTPN